MEVESGGELQEVRGKRITLSAGALVSPAILLRSGIGPAEKLEPHGIGQVLDLPGVGENLVDHFSVGVQAVPKEGTPHDVSVVTEVGLRYTAEGSDQFNDMQLAVSTIFDREQVRGLTGPSAPTRGDVRGGSGGAAHRAVAGEADVAQRRSARAATARNALRDRCGGHAPPDRGGHGCRGG